MAIFLLRIGTKTIAMISENFFENHLILCFFGDMMIALYKEMGFTARG